MQLFADQDFFICLAAASVPAFILGYYEKPICHYGMAISALFIWLAMRENPISILYMTGFVLFEYILIRLTLKIRQTERSLRFSTAVSIILSIAPLIVYKVLTSAGGSPGILAFMGISYLTFKAVQIIIEVGEGIIIEVKLADYLYLMLFFPTLLSGPIDRSRRFEKDLRKSLSREEYLKLAGEGIYRILLGMIYKLVLSAALYYLMKKFGMEYTLQSSFIYLYTYGFYLFFDFAGYSLMATGAGYLLGIKVPDNFNKPFLSKDIQEFWNRWHITLSHWLRDYVFSRITMRMIQSRKIKDKLAIASIGLMTNMLIMGCWHGLTWYYILYGLYHGVLLVLFEVIRKKSRFYKKHRKEKWFIAIEWFVTLHLVLIGFVIFSGRLKGPLSYLVSYF